MNSATDPVSQEKPTGLEDVVRSFRALARTTRGLAEDSANVLERELAMAINISEQIRDNVLSKESLEEARRSELSTRLRRDAHQALDIAIDFATVGVRAAVRLVEGLVDERRPALPTSHVVAAT